MAWKQKPRAKKRRFRRITPMTRDEICELADCPKCEAFSGNQCVKGDGSAREQVHFDRMQAAQHIKNRMDEAERV